MTICATAENLARSKCASFRGRLSSRALCGASRIWPWRGPSAPSLLQRHTLGKDVGRIASARIKPERIDHPRPFVGAMAIDVEQIVFYRAEHAT